MGDRRRAADRAGSSVSPCWLPRVSVNSEEGVWAIGNGRGWYLEVRVYFPMRARKALSGNLPLNESRGIFGASPSPTASMLASSASVMVDVNASARLIFFVVSLHSTHAHAHAPPHTHTHTHTHTPHRCECEVKARHEACATDSVRLTRRCTRRGPRFR